MGPVTEAQRVHLYQTLQREFGDEDAATMMAMLPPPGSAGVATKEDLAPLVTKDDVAQSATKQDLERFASKEDLERFATKFELKDELNRQTRLYITWLLMGNATLTAIFSLLVGVLVAFD